MQTMSFPMTPAPRTIIRCAVINAINLGHDTDTSGAVTGMIAGRLWGYSSIPERWLERLHWKDKIISEADRLYSLNLKYSYLHYNAS